jgi:uncharacterized protein (DUF3084 family)
MKDADDKLKKLELKRASLEAEIKRLRAAASATERKRDTRRKLLVGAVVLGAVDRGETPRAPWMAMLDKHLVRPHDRALFDLPPKPEDNRPLTKTPPQSASAPKAPSALPGGAAGPTPAPPRLPPPAPASVPRGTFMPSKDTGDI